MIIGSNAYVYILYQEFAIIIIIIKGICTYILYIFI
jgi:hypothetical protein